MEWPAQGGVWGKTGRAIGALACHHGGVRTWVGFSDLRALFHLKNLPWSGDFVTLPQQWPRPLGVSPAPSPPPSATPRLARPAPVARGVPRRSRARARSRALSAIAPPSLPVSRRCARRSAARACGLGLRAMLGAGTAWAPAPLGSARLPAERPPWGWDPAPRAPAAAPRASMCTGWGGDAGVGRAAGAEEAPAGSRLWAPLLPGAATPAGAVPAVPVRAGRGCPAAPGTWWSLRVRTALLPSLHSSFSPCSPPRFPSLSAPLHLFLFSLSALLLLSVFFSLPIPLLPSFFLYSILCGFSQHLVRELIPAPAVLSCLAASPRFVVTPLFSGLWCKSISGSLRTGRGVADSSCCRSYRFFQWVFSLPGMRTGALLPLAAFHSICIPRFSASG